jgi:hypothetical protein
VKDVPSVTAALAAAGFELPHAKPAMLKPPFRLHEGDHAVADLTLRTGTLVVIGNLSIAGALELQRDSRPLAHVIVVGSCTLGTAYVDGFLVVRDDLTAKILIADAAWDGGIFVGKDLQADTLAIHKTGVTVKGARRERVFADSEHREAAEAALPALFRDGDVEAYGYFLGLTGRG